ncbi:translesion error-prone DNA polymerase V autoproteolytic subunit [Pseudarthrobacter sp. PS3-L1]|uniref:LexA family protein n=1 Tax=Pseudarthrobacter sp. PS3-L1 TaxID=3046207 RepID=UPI0024B95713|nr:translesion error-prone DNA polymerase V autoproteolytic subunit [Pseudarthrobacter sp. PS3-L1]MDJ0321594.1 translesion error-prone DNA polymerase V autoproteolytic subunit [Pseudarthrobacter sp. PS3-L1]
MDFLADRIPRAPHGAESSPPLESFLPRGFASPAQDYFSGRIDLNKHLIKDITSTYIVRVQGDGMMNAGICDGDELIVDRSLEARSGSVVIAVLDGELMVRRIRRSGTETALVADHPDYADISISADVDMSVWGVVTRCLHRV